MLKRSDASEVNAIVAHREPTPHGAYRTRPNVAKRPITKQPRSKHVPMKKVHRPRPKICYSCGKPGHFGAECTASPAEIRRYRAEYEATRKNRAEAHAVTTAHEGDEFMSAEVHGAEARMSAMALAEALEDRMLVDGKLSRV
jgi:hypothetical protein